MMSEQRSATVDGGDSRKRTGSRHGGARRAAGRIAWPAGLIVLAAAAGMPTAAAAAAEQRPLPSLLVLRTPEPAWTAAELERKYVVYSDSGVQPFMVHQTPARSQITRSVSCRLARDEYEPLLLGVYAFGASEALTDTRIEVSIDLPVTVRRLEYRDYRHRDQLPGYADLQIPDVGMPLANEIERIRPGTTGSFWLTFHAPVSAEPGEHAGTVRITPQGKPATELALTVTVLPFVLPRADIPFGMYSYPTSNLFRDKDYQRKAYHDMIAHGLTSVTVYDSESKWTVDADTGEGSFQFGPRAELELNLIVETGLCPDGIPLFHTDYNVVGWHPAHRRYLGEAGTAAAAAAIIGLGAERAYPKMVFQVEDEPGVDQTPAYHQWAEAWKASPARTATAMNTAAASQLGYLHDVQILHIGGITPEVLAEARRAGSEVWSYHFSHAHSCVITNRYDTGLYTWGLGLAGSFKWVYYHGYNEYVALTSADIQPKPSYEGVREGIDDYRYLRLLEKCIAARANSSAARKASRWLDSVRAEVDWEFYHEGAEPGDRRYFVRPAPAMVPADFDTLRATAVSFIIAVGIPDPLPATDRGSTSPAAKFEASPFADKSVRECVAGLKSRNVYTRRAAAAALALRGAEGAPAVRRLIRQTRDPDVRLPAFRALAAIGAPAVKAVPALAKQLQADDAFVRTGAAHALGRLGGAAVEPLRSALRDDNATVVQAACASLARIGLAAKPAVPDLIAMLGGSAGGASGHIGELSTSLSHFAYIAITGIGPAAAEALPVLLERYCPEDSRGARAEIAKTMSAIVPEIGCLWEPPLGALLWRPPAGRTLLANAPEFWRFRKDEDKVGEKEQWFAVSDVARGPEWKGLSTHDFWPDSYVGDGWYATEMYIPATGEKRVWLYFGAVDENYTLWINGSYIGDNLDVYQRLWDVPVSVEITGKFKQGDFNHIVVRASNTAQAGGVWRPVRILLEAQ